MAELLDNPVLDTFTPDPAIAEGARTPAPQEATAQRIAEKQAPTKLNMQKVYNVSSQSWDDDHAKEAFATDFYRSFYGLPKDVTLAQATRAVHGYEMDATAAVNNINGITKPIGAPDNTPAALDLRNRINENESQVPNDVLTHLHLAVARHDQDSLDGIVAANPDLSKPLTSLIHAYGEVYKQPMIAPGTTADKFLRAVTIPGTAGIYRSIINAVGPSLVAGSKEGLEGMASGASWLVHQAFSSPAQRMKESFPTDEEQAQKDSVAVVEKAHRVVTRALEPDQEGVSMPLRAVQSGVRMVPTLAAMIAQPELAPSIGITMVKQHRDELMDEHGLTEQQANIASIPSAVVAAFGSNFIPKFGTAGQEATDAVAQSLMDSLKKFSMKAGSNVVHSEIGMTMFQAANVAGDVGAKVLFDKGENVSDTFRKGIAGLPEVWASGLVLAGPDILRAGSESFTPKPPVAGDPYKVAVADKAREQAGLSKIQDAGAPEHTPEVLAEFANRAKQIVEQERATQKVEETLTDKEKDDALRKQSAAGAVPQPEQPGKQEGGEGVRQGEQGNAQPAGARQNEASRETPDNAHQAPAQVLKWEQVPNRPLMEGATWETKPENREKVPEAAKAADEAGLRFDGAWEAMGKHPAAWSFTDPKTGDTVRIPVGSSAEDLMAWRDTNRANPDVIARESARVTEAHKNALIEAGAGPEAPVEYKYHVPKEEVDAEVNRQPNKSREQIERELRKAQEDAVFGTAKSRALQRMTERFQALKQELKSGKIAADLAARTKVEDIHSEITGKDTRPEGMRPRTYEAVLRDTFKAGRQSKQFPLSKIAEAALDAKDKTLSSTSREARLSSYRTDMAQADDAIALLKRSGTEGKLAARGILNDMFGGERAKQIARNFHAEGVHDDLAQFEAIKSELEDRAKALMGANITRVFGSGRDALTLTARKQLDALAKEYEPGLDKVADEMGAEKGNLSFAVDQAQKLADAKRKNNELDTALQQQGKITPAQLEARQEAVSGQQSAVEKFYQSLPIDVANKFHDSMVDIVRGSKQEIAANEQAKREDTKVSAATAVPEIKASTEAKFTSTKHEGLLRRLNVASGDAIKRLGGLFNRNSETRRVLADEPFQADGEAYLKERALNQARMPQIMKDNGISNLEVAKWAHDHELRDIGGQKVLLSTGQMIDLWNQSHDESTVTEFARGGVKAIEEVGRTGKEWKPDTDIKHGENAATDSVKGLLSFLDAALTPAQKAYGKAMVEGYNDPELRAKTNESAMYFKNGIPLIAEDAGTWHPRTRERGTETDDELQGDTPPRNGKLQDIFSSVKARQSNAHPVMAMDATTRYDNYMRRATKYAYLAPTLDAASRLMESPDMKQALLDRVDTKGVNRIRDTYRAMAGINDASPKSLPQRWLEKTQTFNALWFNITGAADVRLLSTISAGIGIGQEHGALAMGKFLLQSAPSILLPKEINAGPLGKIEIQPKDIADREVLANSSGYLAKRFDSRTANTAETLPESGAADLVRGPGSASVLKAAGNAIYNRGLKAYDTAHVNTLVEVYQYAKNAGMSEDEAVRFTEQSCRDWQTPSHPMDYTKSYQGTIPMRLFNPFSGAASRFAAKGGEAVASWRQAKTPEEKTQAYKNLVYWTAGLVAVSGVRSIFNNMVSSRIQNGSLVIPPDDKRSHVLRDGAINALTMGVNPWAGKVAQGVANGVEYAEDPSTITTLGGAGNMMRGLATLVKAHASDEKIDWSNEKNKKAAQAVAIGALESSRILGAAAVRNEKFIVGGGKKGE